MIICSRNKELQLDIAQVEYLTRNFYILFPGVAKKKAIINAKKSMRIMECFLNGVWLLSPFQLQRESQTVLITLVHYILVICSRVAGESHSQPVQYIPIIEQMKTILAVSAFLG